MLKNDGVLPIDKNTVKTIGVIGPNANSRLALKGNYYGTSSRYITVLEGIQDEVGDEVRVLYAKGCELVKSKTETLAKEYDRKFICVKYFFHIFFTLFTLLYLLIYSNM